MEFGRRATAAVVAADPHRLSQVLINLISNAIKYNNSKRPTVTVTSRVVGADYQIDVADNGPGITRADREQIFEKFYRGRHGRSPSVAGAGLGLAISRQIIKRMNGELELLPGEGPGACFRITLPLSASNGTR